MKCAYPPQKTWAEETGISRAPRVLLASVFGPYAQDDKFGSRAINPMELLHNQITRAQGAYSLRYSNRSRSLTMIQANISAPSTVLDFPTLKGFKKELASHRYDIVGITSIGTNVGKVKEMCRVIRLISPHSRIIIGGHVASIPDLKKIVDADHVVKGEGISWMRKYLGENADAPIRHPVIPSTRGFSVMGIHFPDALVTPNATIIPSVGCPMGCNFCNTSAFFGGKGKFVDFFKTTEELFKVMCRSSSVLKTSDFHIQDENFLLQRKRAMELLELMKENGKSWSFFVFASANALKQYTMEELVGLGVSMVWIGLESSNTGYSKLKGIDTVELVKKLKSHGIRVVGSSIIGMEHHTPENIMDEIEHAVAHNSDFQQFMLYTPGPGTPLYSQLESKGLLLKDVDWADMHGQYKFNFKHPYISRDDSKKFLDRAFQRDFEKNGPSIYRNIETLMKGWKRYKNHPDRRIRKRFQWDARQLKTTATPMLWALEHIYKKKDKEMSKRMQALRLEIEDEFGVSVRFAAKLLGPVLVCTSRMQERKITRGVAYEPKTVIERKNWHS